MEIKFHNRRWTLYFDPSWRAFLCNARGRRYDPQYQSRERTETIWGQGRQVGNFNECMSGFEHQVAAHMMAEGMTEEALILTRMVHDHYYAANRNPWLFRSVYFDRYQLL